MTPLRLLAAVALPGSAAFPVARVYTADAPQIDHIQIHAGQATRLRGHGVPGTPLVVTVTDCATRYVDFVR